MIFNIYFIHRWDSNSGPGSNGNEEVLHIPQISKTGTSP